MILFFTDFGVSGPYVGQMKAAAARRAPHVPAIDLTADAPAFAPKPAAYLLAALADPMPAPAVFVCVVDPGVGGSRRPLAMRAGGKLFVGPDNGLLELVRRRAEDAEVYEIVWKPERLSASFHGRDLFTPVAAALAADGWEQAVRNGVIAPLAAPPPVGADWPDDWPAVVYTDHYGNAMSGVRAAAVSPAATFVVDGAVLPRGRTFCDAPPGEALVYENSCGLLEIAVNGGSAAGRFRLAPGAALTSAEAV